ncbi:MAG: ComEC/Rec2 family competence protein [Kiritimatiellae bacterium]|nr:ComEC/Rec2 family competence protein [Kiritimatiellia bacterium]
MSRTAHVILGCYAFMVGLAVMRLYPLDPAVLPWLRAATTLTMGAAALAFILAGRGKANSGAARRLAAPLLCAGAVLLGMTRHTSANTMPDMRIGEFRIHASERALHLSAAMPDTSRVRIRKTGPLERDLKFRLLGELDARIPERDAEGVPRMDAQGRWQFRVVRTAVVSDPIVIEAAAPTGSEVIPHQPFTRLTGVEWIDGPDRGSVAIYRVSNHIGSFVRAARAQSPVTVFGRITGDPRVYDFQTILIVTPEFIQYPAHGPFYRVEGGDIQVTVQPDMAGYASFARTSAFGADIVAEGELTVAQSAQNPGGFDARRFMQNYNIFGLMRPYASPDLPPPVRIVAPEGQAPRPGAWIVRISLELRDRVLQQFKATMPYPQSAFLGGVVLGLRYGLQGAQYPGERETGPWAERLGIGRSESRIADDFRASGVNHVLAVSGLHVTILTVMFVGLFSLLRFPRKVSVPLVIFALVIFAIITGARPSTLRAVIMNGLFLLTWAYFDKGLRSSALLGVPVAAFLILMHNPLVLVDPSFTLSFGAILSLALLTTPSHNLLGGLSGNRFLVVIVFTAATTLIGIVRWALVSAPSFLIPWLVFAVIVFRFSAAMDRRGIGVPPRFAFRALPGGVGAFIAAQVAIQVGMMVPLSAYYFCRWPFAGAFANLIAIPLIGVVVQLGAIAGLLGMIPGVGPFIALLLNAANWLFSSIFLWLAHVFAKVFPYPIVRRPSEVEIAVYYIFVAAWIWRRPIWAALRGWCERRGWSGRRAPAILATALAMLGICPLALAPSTSRPPSGMRATVLSVGYGSAILVESPGGKRILIDTGFVEHERGRRNEADRTILPFLSTIGASRIDGLILTSPLPERSAGASTILAQLRVGTLVIPPMMAGLEPGMSREDFTHQLEGEGSAGASLAADRIERAYHELIGNPQWPRRPSWIQALRPRGQSWVNRWAQWDIRIIAAGAGTTLFEESSDSGPFRIEVLGPAPEPAAEHPIENNGLALRIVHGDVAILLPGALHYEGQRRLAMSNDKVLNSKILVVPHQGAANPSGVGRTSRELTVTTLERATAPLLDRVRPEVAIFEFGNPRPVLADEGRTAIGVYELTRRFYRERLGEERVLGTDHDGAIVIESDGRTYAIDTQARRNRALGGTEDAVSDIAIGL